MESLDDVDVNLNLVNIVLGVSFPAEFPTAGKDSFEGACTAVGGLQGVILGTWSTHELLLTFKVCRWVVALSNFELLDTLIWLEHPLVAGSEVLSDREVDVVAKADGKTVILKAGESRFI